MIVTVVKMIFVNIFFKCTSTATFFDKTVVENTRSMIEKVYGCGDGGRGDGWCNCRGWEQQEEGEEGDRKILVLMLSMCQLQ